MKKRSIGQKIMLAGNAVLCIGLLLHGLDVIDKIGLRVFLIITLIIDGIALYFIKKHSEF